jgi:dolichyl-diphosphooligosaccharide--protein glycosyltransferase
MWQLIHNDEIETIDEWLSAYPESVAIRSEDGRGPLWWAYEEGNSRLVDLFISHGASVDEKDAKGLKPIDLKKK